MLRNVLLVVAGYASAFALQAQEDRTIVVNLKEPHPIRGDVVIPKPIPHSMSEGLNEVIVAPATREQTSLWTEVGTIETDGFTSMVLSLQGQLRGSTNQVGRISIVLVPEEESVLRALAEGEVHLALEAFAEPVPAGGLYFSGSQSGLPIAFPRYRVFMYNTTDRSASVDAFAYLTH